MGGGDFIQGLTGGIQNAMQMRQQSVDNQMRAEYMKTQKKLMDMQWKAAEMEELWWNQQPANIRGLKFMPKEAQTIGMLMSGIMPLPGMAPVGGGGGTSTPPSPMPASAGAQPVGWGGPPMELPAENMPPQIQPQGGPDGGQLGAAAQSTPSGLPDVISQMVNRGLWKKTLGIDPGELTYLSGTRSPTTGRPATLALDPTGNTVREFPDFTEADKAFSVQSAKDVAEKQKNLPKVRDTLVALNRQWDLVEKTIDEAIGMSSLTTTGFGSLLANVPGTTQKTLGKKLETIKANIGFDKLQQMRNDSPTGGALGQISDKENLLLQAVQGSLDQSLSDEELIKNLQQIKDNLAEIRQEKNESFMADYRFNPIKPKPSLRLSGKGPKKAGRKPLTAFEGQ